MTPIDFELIRQSVHRLDLVRSITRWRFGLQSLYLLGSFLMTFKWPVLILITACKSGHLSLFLKSCVIRLLTTMVLLIHVSGFRVTIRLDTDMESQPRIFFHKTQEASITSTIKVFSGDFPCTPAEEILVKVFLLFLIFTSNTIWRKQTCNRRCVIAFSSVRKEIAKSSNWYLDKDTMTNAHLQLFKMLTRINIKWKTDEILVESRASRHPDKFLMFFFI